MVHALQYRGIDPVTSPVSGSADAENTTVDSGSGSDTFAGTGQSWTSPSSPSEVTGVRLALRHPSAGTPAYGGVMRVSVYAESSDVPSGAALVSSPFYATDGIAAGAGYTNYYFPLSGWTPAASTKYVFYLEIYGLFSASNTRVAWQLNTTSAYAGGVLVSTDASWRWPSTTNLDNTFIAASTQDLDFTVYSVNGSGGGGGGVGTMTRLKLSTGLGL